MPEDDLITSPEAAEVLGKSTRTVNRMAERGLLPYAHKLPGRTGSYLFRRQVIELIAQRPRSASKTNGEAA